MMKEIVSAQLGVNALQPILSLLTENVVQDQQSQDKLFQQFKQEAKVFRYPQITEGITYLGVLVQHRETEKIVQLLLEVGEATTIVDSLWDPNDKLEAYIDIELTIKSEQGSTFSAEFWQNFYQLQADPHHEAVLNKLQSWLIYSDYLLTQKNIPHTIKNISKTSNNKYEISFYEEERMKNFTFKKGDSIMAEYAFNEIEVGEIVTWKPESNEMIISSKQNFAEYKDTTVKIYNSKDYKELKKNHNEIDEILTKELKKPSLKHSLLNPFHSISSNQEYYGFSTKEEDLPVALEQLLSIAETKYDKIAVVLDRPELEESVINQYTRILPVDSSGEKSQAIQYLKKPIIEKSSVKLVEFQNKVSEEELKIQQNSIEEYSTKVEKIAQKIDMIEGTQKHLSENSTKNTNKINSFVNLIASYQDEQEQLAFRNDQLIKVKLDLENSIKDQRQILGEIAEQQEKDQQYYANLEKNWLQFNQESTIYTEHIINLKNIKKAEKIIGECEDKLKIVQDTLSEGEALKQGMLEQYEEFKLNQQVEKVDQVISKIKATADFVAMPIDLQFANSYAELTNIYMNKFAEIEELEERFSLEQNRIDEELYNAQLSATKPAVSHYNYDRHYAEEKMATVLNLIDRKPISLGLNYKAKQRWKETLSNAVEDLYSMQLCMKMEKQVLENKLMAQLQYAEQLVQYFDNDISKLNEILEDQKVNLTASEEEYKSIIETANIDIKDMKQKVQDGLMNTKGRSEKYATLDKLEKTRKSFKVELLAKYELLEIQANDIENAIKYIQILETKHSEKVKEVLTDKQEMDVQIDVLQHDIVNSKEAIENLKQENQVINAQYEELVQQIHINQKESDVLIGKISVIQQDIMEKEKAFLKNDKLLNSLRKWHELLQSEQNDIVWKKLVEEKSKLRFYHSFESYEAQKNEVIIFEDQQYSWIDAVIKLKKYANALFITTDLSQRSINDEADFNSYLIQKELNVLERKQVMENLKENPFSNYADIFENDKKPYLVQADKKIMLM